jgi:CheY-like chemotaxis protein
MPGASDTGERPVSAAEWTALNARLRYAEAKLEQLQSEPPDNEFLAMLAHEFRNPLAPIRSAVEIMRVIGQKDPALEKAREVIARQVDHLSRLVDQLLDVSRVTKGAIELEKAAVDINSVLWRAVEIAQPLIDERGHTLKVLPLSQSVSVEGDFTRLAQVIGNLLDNAARYTDANGEIVVSASKEKNYVAICIKDNGIGIAPESLSFIFDLFTQAHRTADRPQGGLGIGLSLVRKLVEMHGGTVEAISPGLKHGSEFIVRLPLMKQAARAVQSLKTPAGRETPRRIVVIDDNFDAAESLAMLLRLKGHEVHVAYDGPAGVALALKMDPDSVLIDIGLPGIDGYEVAKQLRAQENGRALLVALTGYGQTEDRIKSEQAGFDHHLVKPVAQNVLEDLLRER